MSLSRLTVALLLVLASAAGAERRPQWTWQLPPRKPAWEHTPRIRGDVAYEPAGAAHRRTRPRGGTRCACTSPNRPGSGPASACSP
jgi:hypothetical protein